MLHPEIHSENNAPMRRSVLWALCELAKVEMSEGISSPQGDIVTSTRELISHYACCSIGTTSRILSWLAEVGAIEFIPDDRQRSGRKIRLLFTRVGGGAS